MQVWNSELANVAQTYAEQCILEHNSNRTSQQDTFNTVGENLCVTSLQNANFTNSVRGWFDQRNNYNYQSNSCNGVCAQYTQVINLRCMHACMQ